MYDSYQAYIRTIRNKNEPFKRNPVYTEILEHVSPEQGTSYVSLLRSEFGMSDDRILGFCLQNDAFGDPVRHQVGDLPIPVSPTSLRYLYHASLILRHAGPTQSSFVEVGCGYGGLFLALTYLAPTQITNYHMVDLDDAIALLRLVVGEDSRVTLHSATTFGRNVPDGCFLISNYCFSELDAGLRESYRSQLISRTPHGFLAWNIIPYEDAIIGHTAVVTPERPMTGPGNLFVWF